MISSYNSASQDVVVNGLISFDTTRLEVGCATSQENPSSFKLDKSGYYYISFNADVATSATAGDIVVSLQNNGVIVPGAKATVNSAATTDISNISFSTIVQVLPSCWVCSNAAVLTLVNSGVAATFSNVNLNIMKIG